MRAVVLKDHGGCHIQMGFWRVTKSLSEKEEDTSGREKSTQKGIEALIFPPKAQTAYLFYFIKILGLLWLE